jgi:hypothetical protein
MSRRRRALAVHITVNLVEIDGAETTILDTRQGSQGSGSGIEQLRRHAHDMIDAYVYGLATRIPPAQALGDNLEAVGTFGREGIVVLERRDLELVLETLTEAVEMSDDGVRDELERIIAELGRQGAS